MARKPTFRKSTAIIEALNNVESVSRFLALQLVEAGYLKIDVIHSERRGRPQHRYVLTGKARGYLALSRNWGRKLQNLKQNYRPIEAANSNVAERLEVAA